MLAKNGFSIWYFQFRNDPATQNAFGLYAKMLVMLTYPKLFFSPPENTALSLLLAFMFWTQQRFIKDLPKLLKIYSLILIIAFWLITKRNTGYYLILFMPFMLVLIYELYKAKPFDTIGLRVVLFVYFLIGLFGTFQLINKNLNTEYLPVAYKKLEKSISPTQLGLVPLTFFFNEYEHYPHLLSHENYTYYSKKPDNSSAEMANWAYDHQVGFILMDYTYRPEYFYPAPGTPVLPHYKLSFFDGRFAVYTTSPEYRSK